MRLTLSVYVSVEREEGRSVYLCRPLRGPQVVSRDPLLSQALSKLGNKMRKSINGWIEEGQAGRISPWLYEPEARSSVTKLTLVLRDRTLRWKILIVSVPVFGRYILFSPSVPDTTFEVDSLQELELRADEVYTVWAQSKISEGAEYVLDEIGEAGDMWIEGLEVEVETNVRNLKKSRNILAALFGGGKTSGSEELHKVGQCLDDLAADFTPAIGRRELVDEVDRMLQRDDRQGVLLVGPPAVGKTAIVQECVARRNERVRERRDQKPQTWWLSPQRLISGMSYLGQWEQRWLSILREAAKRDHVLYFDDLVGLFTAGRTRDSSLSAADVLRSFLAEHQVRILAESTAEQLAVLRRRDRALADRFHLVHVPALSAQDALPIALQASHDLEVRTERYFHPEIIPLVMQQQETFAPDRAFPGKAIEMCKTLTKHSPSVIDRHRVYQLAGAQVGASMLLLLGGLGNQQKIQAALSRQLIGQPAAVAALSRTVIRYAQHLQPPDRPLGVLLLLGPTGVGKTEAAKALTRLLYTDEAHLVRLDMNELTTPFAAEQLVGTFDQPEGRLTSAVRRQPNCVILLDEIEKAHPDVFDYLLQVIGEGRLTDARGRVADFRSTIIIMTSNLGAAEQNQSLGFEITSERRQQIYVKAAQQFFRPEFFNRLDEVVAFRHLDARDMEQIVVIQLDQVLSRDGIKRRNIFVRVNDSAIKQVIRRGFDSLLGARAVRRMLESEIMGPLGDCLSQMPSDRPALVHVAHTPPAPRLDCRVVHLQLATPHPPQREDDLAKLLEVGRPFYETLDARLSELADELRAIDDQAHERTHAASYYALREQLYRSSELLKAARFRLSRQREPSLDVTAPTPLKPRRDSDGAGVRRGIRDWHAQEDLRLAISDRNSPAADEKPLSAKELAKQLVDSLTIAQAMIDTALQPRHWLVGFQSITAGPELERQRLQAAGTPHAFRNDQAMLDDMSAPNLLSRLVNCLKYRWQYEVSELELPSDFRLVSGISLIGILGPLLGTYQRETSSGASHLQVLRAIPVDSQATPDELKQLIADDQLLDAQGDLRTPAYQAWPTTLIRGAVGEITVDYISTAETQLSARSWFHTDKILTRTMQWWIDCLPVPQALWQE